MVLSSKPKIWGKVDPLFSLRSSLLLYLGASSKPGVHSRWEWGDSNSSGKELYSGQGRDPDDCPATGTVKHTSALSPAPQSAHKSLCPRHNQQVISCLQKTFLQNYQRTILCIAARPSSRVEGRRGTFIDQELCARSFPYTNSFYPYNDLMKQIILSPFFRQENKAEKVRLVTQNHTACSWQSQNMNSVLAAKSLLSSLQCCHSRRGPMGSPSVSEQRSLQAFLCELLPLDQWRSHVDITCAISVGLQTYILIMLS